MNFYFVVSRPTVHTQLSVKSNYLCDCSIAAHWPRRGRSGSILDDQIVLEKKKRNDALWQSVIPH